MLKMNGPKLKDKMFSYVHKRGIVLLLTSRLNICVLIPVRLCLIFFLFNPRGNFISFLDLINLQLPFAVITGFIKIGSGFIGLSTYVL